MLVGSNLAWCHPVLFQRLLAAREKHGTRIVAIDPRATATTEARIRDQWHTMTRTAKTPRLMAHIGEPFVEIHPDDAKSTGVKPADLAVIESAHGRVVLASRLLHCGSNGERQR